MNIGLVGGLGSGKTTIANYLVEKYGYTKKSLADPMREIVKNILGIEDKSDPRYRPAMQELGTEWGRKYDKDCWVKYLHKHLDNTATVVDDVRFANEALALIRWGWKLLFLECNGDIRAERCLKRDGNFDSEALLHQSEQDIKNIQKRFISDLIVINTSKSIVEALNKIDFIMKELN